MKLSIQPSVNLVESMRDMGYTLETALADIIDNSVSAEARNIHIYALPSLPLRVAIVDDGLGMDQSDLHRALTLADMPPSANRQYSDLGRFGLGLKTASWSQGRRFTVVSSKKGARWGACVDLDHIRDSSEWAAELLTEAQVNDVPYASELPHTGTLVLWEKLDRLEHDTPEQTQRVFSENLAEAVRHLELVFHRFLAREGNYSPVSIFINGRPLEPHDPFCESHPATQRLPDEYIRVAPDQGLTMTVFTLPHHSKLSPAEGERLAGPGGYLKNQGFYLYRARRLIVWGTWFRLTKSHPSLNLARIRLDIPNNMDDQWAINIMKAHATPPPAVRERLRALLYTLSSRSTQVYSRRGHLQTNKTIEPMWLKKVVEGRISYVINGDNPLVEDFANTLDELQKHKLERFLRLISAALPLESLFTDLNASSNGVKSSELSIEDVRESASVEFEVLRRRFGDERARDILSQKAPYNMHTDVLSELMGGGANE